MAVAKETKETFVANLSRYVLSSAAIQREDVLDATYHLIQICKQDNIVVTDLFTPEEYKKTEEDMFLVFNRFTLDVQKQEKKVVDGSKMRKEIYVNQELLESIEKQFDSYLLEVTLEELMVENAKWESIRDIGEKKELGGYDTNDEHNWTQGAEVPYLDAPFNAQHMVCEFTKPNTEEPAQLMVSKQLEADQENVRAGSNRQDMTNDRSVQQNVDTQEMITTERPRQTTREDAKESELKADQSAWMSKSPTFMDAKEILKMAKSGSNSRFFNSEAMARCCLRDYEREAEKIRNQLDKEESDISIAKLKLTCAETASVAQAEREIVEGQAKIKELKKKCLENQKAFLANRKKWIKDEATREAYSKFISQQDAIGDRILGDEEDTLEIKQNDRIIRTLKCLDVDVVFEASSSTGSCIQFADNETIDLLINSQLSLHPRALNQMNQYSRSKAKKTDLENMMELTRKYTESTMENYQGDREEEKRVFLREIRPCLANYKMITRVEQEEVVNAIGRKFNRSKTEDDQKLVECFAKMTPEEAFRLRIFCTADTRYFVLAYKAAATYGDKSIQTFTNWLEISMLEQMRAWIEEPVATRQRWTEYHQQLKEWEIEGLLNEGKTRDEAEAIASENFQWRENIEDAREQYKNGRTDNIRELIQLSRNGPPLKLRKYQKMSFVVWTDSRLDRFFNALLDPSSDQTVFDDKMAVLIEDINRVFKVFTKIANPSAN